jgi:hypothetical protein
MRNKPQCFFRRTLPAWLRGSKRSNSYITRNQAELGAYVPNLKISGQHQFFVLTYSPTVILFVPGKPRLDKLCYGEDYRVGCFTTSKLFNTNFQYGPRPEVADGSFVLIPSNSKPIYIPNGSKTFEFTLLDSTLKLPLDSQHWSVIRYRQK